MSAIETYLQYIANKVWARDVRTAIVNAIRQCYDDVHNPTLNTEAIQAAVQAKIDAGQMAALTIGDRTITAAKLALGVIPTPDTTLSQSGVPADAKKAGDEITTIRADLGAQVESLQDLEETVNAIEPGLSNAAKTAILNCFRNIALWTDGNYAECIATLEAALNNDIYPKLVATFNPGSNEIFAHDALSTLKQYLTVKYYESASSQGEVISANSYTLSGTLAIGQSVVRVEYNNLSTAFALDVADFYNRKSWNYPNDSFLSITLGVWGLQDGDLGISGVTNNTRRSLYSTAGKWPCKQAGKPADNRFYPIPIPLGSTKANISLNPSSMVLAATVWQYNENTQKYQVLSGTSTGWVTGSVTMNLPTGNNLVLIISYRYSDSRSMEGGTGVNSISLTFE